MTQDKDILDNLGYLDKIIDYLIHNCKAYSCNYDDLYQYFYGRDLKNDNKFNALGYYTAISEPISNNLEDFFFSFSVSDNTQAQGEKLVEACYYLMKHEYIRIDSQFNIKITFDGILKFNDNFTSNYQRKLSDSERMISIADTQLTQNGQIVVANKQIAKLTFWIMVGAIVAAFYQVVQLVKDLFSYWICIL